MRGDVIDTDSVGIRDYSDDDGDDGEGLVDDEVLDDDDGVMFGENDGIQEQQDWINSDG